MKKIVLFALAFVLALSLAACVNYASSSQPQESASVPASQPDSEPASEAFEDNELVMPVVAGSNAYDVTVSLEDTGIECERSAKSSTDGYYFSGANDTNTHIISIETDKDYAVGYIRADFMGNEYDGYLGFVASFPRDDGTEQDAMDWVNENYGTDTTTTFGNATYELYVTDNGGCLIIKADGYDDYALAVLKAAE